MLFGKKKKAAPKTMGEAEMWQFINATCRAEADGNTWAYMKAIRVSLYALGYDENWLADTFRPALEYFYSEERDTGEVVTLAETIRRYNERLAVEAGA